MPVKKLQGKDFEELIPLEDSYNELASLLTSSDVPIELGSFDNFVQNIYAKSFPEYDFNTWHIHHLAELVQKILNNPDNKYLLAVLPRYHLKSSILGYAVSIYRMITSYGEGLYLSYKEELAAMHCYHIKEAVRNNPILFKIMIDLSPQSDSTINYKIGSHRCKIYPSGMLAVKRGLHTSAVCIADDLMGDVQNPMVMTEIDKAIRIFDAEVMNIPNKECPMIVFGTVISDNDLLFHLKEKPKFNEHTVWMPALYPDGEHEVLWEKMYNRQWLEQRKIDIGWKAFSTEFLLTPVMSTEAFVTKEQLDTIVDKDLRNFQIPGLG